MEAYTKRPRYLNLLKIKLPIAGMVSIFHRVTGVWLFIAIPFSLYWLQLSLQDKASFDQAFAYLNSPISRFFILLMIWSLVHHLFAGIRYLFIDFEIGVEKDSSRYGAWLVVVVELVVMAMILLGLFL